ncbi:cytochrome B [Pseudomonas sp. SDI]|uniref:cytochrome b n=1 Tax=Pseudomonas sp. SDI TaxID=2170734 RepID=UPI000DE68792|nr:cytochrome b/b6 domain-containing protein [Pseudomonas sp. SDI]PWB31118.1 cytochrome B [Pseudomonas sp. SDI]
MNTRAYSAAQIVLHWLSAVVIIWTLASGFLLGLDVLGRNEQLARFNVALTTVFIPFFVLRCVLRLIRPVNKLATGNATQALLAELVHALLYGVTALVLLTGVLMMRQPIDVFGWVQFPAPLDIGPLSAGLGSLHIGACVVLSLLVALHAGAVLLHTLAGRPVLKRMSVFR